MSTPHNFGLSPVEILLASDAELNTVAPVKTLAPYRRGLGVVGKGLGKRVRELKGELRKRRWGDTETSSSTQFRRIGTGSNDVPVGLRNGGEPKERKGKRLGRKQRLKAKRLEEKQGPLINGSEGGAGSKRYNASGQDNEDTLNGHSLQSGAESEGRKRRKKSKRDKAESDLQIFD